MKWCREVTPTAWVWELTVELGGLKGLSCRQGKAGETMGKLERGVYWRRLCYAGVKWIERTVPSVCWSAFSPVYSAAYFAWRPKWAYKGQDRAVVGSSFAPDGEGEEEGLSPPWVSLRRGSGRVAERLPSAPTCSQSPFLHQRQVRTLLILPATTCPPGDAFLY